MPQMVYRDSARKLIVAMDEARSTSAPLVLRQTWTFGEYARHLKETELQSFPDGAVEARIASLPEMPEGMLERALA